MRRQFQLPQGDINTLEASGLAWESVVEPTGQWVLIQQRPLPAGFNIARTDVGLAIPPSYPDAQIDSVLFRDCPCPVNGAHLSKVTHYRLDGCSWHHFCRHRSKLNPWRPGLDDIASHLALVDYWLLKATGRAR